MRWLVGSPAFAQGVAHAERRAAGGGNNATAGSDAGAHKRVRRHRVSEDAQMGFWLSRHPSLRLVSLPPMHGWFDVFAHVGPPSQLLLAHRVPWDQMAWLTEHTERLWAPRNASAPVSAVRVRALCDTEQPPCDPAMCAHAPGQRACALEVSLPESDASRGMGCFKCDCWATDETGRKHHSGGKCGFSREARPRLPEHCWRT